MRVKIHSGAGDIEDDILEYRTAPFPSKISDTSTASITAVSNRAENNSLDGQMISKATDQAASAALSIFCAGGSESTALQTAKAAAASVLRNYFEEKNGTLGNGPKEWFVKRRIKIQAEVIASMALVAAHHQSGRRRRQRLNEDYSTTETNTTAASTKSGSPYSNSKRVNTMPTRSMMDIPSQTHEEGNKSICATCTASEFNTNLRKVSHHSTDRAGYPMKSNTNDEACVIASPSLVDQLNPFKIFDKFNCFTPGGGGGGDKGKEVGFNFDVLEHMYGEEKGERDVKDNRESFISTEHSGSTDSYYNELALGNTTEDTNDIEDRYRKAII